MKNLADADEVVVRIPVVVVGVEVQVALAVVLVDDEGVLRTAHNVYTTAPAAPSLEYSGD